MSTPESTCWTVVCAAVAGSRTDREELARRYLGVVRAYLRTRWRTSQQQSDLDDAVQEVFVECFRAGGALDAVVDGRVPSFRAFLYGIVRNVARRFEARPVRVAIPLPDVAADEEITAKAARTPPPSDTAATVRRVGDEGTTKRSRPRSGGALAGLV